MKQEIFRLCDIRGEYGLGLAKEGAYLIGYAFAKMHISEGNKVIYFGFDSRASSEELAFYLFKGMEVAGAEVKNLGLVSSPFLYFVDYISRPAASIMVTASHNPSQDNGFKMMGNNEVFWGDKIQALYHETSKIEKEALRQIPDEGSKIILPPIENKLGSYLDTILRKQCISKDLLVVWDPGNGATGDILQALIERLPNRNIIINQKPDGTFPNHHPDPTIETNLKQLKLAMKEQNADIGIAFDGDGDRLGVVDSEGNSWLGDELLFLFGEDLLSRDNKAVITADVKSSDIICQELESMGAVINRCKTGHAFIKSFLKTDPTIFAAEASGHIYFTDEYYGFDDAIYAALRMLDLLSRRGVKLSDIYNSLPQRFVTNEARIPVQGQCKFEIIEKLKTILETEGREFNNLDGIKYITKEGWWLVRASNTQDDLVVKCEGIDANSLLEKMEDLAAQLEIFNLQSPFSTC